MSDYKVLEDPVMLALYERAEREGLWLHCHYQDLWFSPAELRERQESGQFCWGPVNWTLRPASECLAQIERERDNKIEEIRRLQARMIDGLRKVGL